MGGGDGGRGSGSRHRGSVGATCGRPGGVRPQTGRRTCDGPRARRKHETTKSARSHRGRQGIFPIQIFILSTNFWSVWLCDRAVLGARQWLSQDVNRRSEKLFDGSGGTDQRSRRRRRRAHWLIGAGQLRRRRSARGTGPTASLSNRGWDSLLAILWRLTHP